MKKHKSKKGFSLVKRGIGVEKHIWDFILTIIFLIIDVVILNELDDTIQQYNLWWVIGAFILSVALLLVGIWQLAAYYVVDIEYSDGRNLSERCKYSNRFCCGQGASKSLGENYLVIPTKDIVARLEKEYSLYTYSHIVEFEKNFKSKKGKEIWIISSNLNSEVTSFPERSESEMLDNIHNNVSEGIRYYFLYSNDIKDPETIERNIRSIKSYTHNNPNVSFIPYGEASEALSEYLLYLFGVVIYVKDDDSYEGFFAIRNHSNLSCQEPIYQKMPICMTGKYLHYMQTKRSEQESTKNESTTHEEESYKCVHGLSEDLYQLRYNTFVVEQGIPYNDEFKGDEERFSHCCLYKGSVLIAAARVGIEGDYVRISRIAVKKEFRNQGRGTAILKYAENEAKVFGKEKILIIAQVRAMGFYEKMGYIPDGEPYIEAGILHVRMTKPLPNTEA